MQHPQPPNDDNEAEPQQELNPEDLDDDNDIGFNEIPLIDPTPMRRAFMRLGLAPIAAQEFINNGIVSPDDLRVMTSEHLFRLIKQIHRDNMNGIFIPYRSQQYIEAILSWANRQHITGRPYTAQHITRDLATQWIERMKEELVEKEAKASAIAMVKTPDPFKKDTKWRSWKESVITYLNAQIGQANLPLSYIIREHEEPDLQAIFTTTHDELVNCAILHGTEFNTNNGRVYDFLQSLALNGPAWPWIYAFQRTRDGRGAWKALLAYYEGDAMQTRTKQECYQAITKANYQGPRRN